MTDDLRTSLVQAATSGDDVTVMRLVALLWSGCPVDALEKAARSNATIERLASAKHPRTPEAARPMLMREGSEADRLFWLGVVVHALSDFENGAERGWKSLHRAAKALAALAVDGELVDTATNAIGGDLIEAASPDTPPARLAELGLHPLPLVTALLVPRRDLPETAELAMSLAQSHPVIAEKVALRTKSPLVLAKLAERNTREDWRIRGAIAGNVHTPVEILDTLANDRTFQSLHLLAANPALTPALQLTIAARAERHSAEVLAANPSVTAEAIAALLGIAKPPHRQIAESPQLTPEIAEKLLAHLADPRISGGRYDWTARGLAENPRCPEHILRELHERYPARRRFVAANPSCPDDLRLAYEAVAETDTAIRGGLAKNPRTSPALLARWTSDVDEHGAKSDFDTRIALAANPAVSGTLLAKLAMSPDYTEASRAAMNPSCPPEVLARIAERDTASMRAVLSSNPACATSILEQALHGLIEDDLDEDGLVRKASHALWARRR